MYIDVPDTEVDSEVNNVAKLSIVTENDYISFKNGIFLTMTMIQLVSYLA